MEAAVSADSFKLRTAHLLIIITMRSIPNVRIHIGQCDSCASRRKCAQHASLPDSEKDKLIANCKTDAHCYLPKFSPVEPFGDDLKYLSVSPNYLVPYQGLAHCHWGGAI